MLRTLSLAALPLFLAPAAHAGVWTVGSGGDFGEISDAVAAAAPGDTLLVLPEWYEPFVLDKPLTIVGLGMFVGTNRPFVDGDVRIVGLPAGLPAVLSNVICDDLMIEGCEATLVLERADSDTLLVDDCDDVRLSGFRTDRGSRVARSRVEWRASQISGIDGDWASYSFPRRPIGDGTPALVLGRRARVHVASSGVDGGHGGHALYFGQTGGDGAPAVVVGPFSELLLTHFGGSVRGGDGGQAPGSPPICSQFGSPAPAVVSEGGLALVPTASTYDLYGGRSDLGGACGGPFVAPPAVGPGVVASDEAAAYLDLFNWPQLGTTSTFRLRGASPGETIRLEISREPARIATPGVVVEDLVGPGLVVPMPPPPSAGAQTTYPHAWPSDWPVGTVVFAQAELVSAAGTRRTNSVPIVLR